jgi:hypothetical protein
LEFVEKTGRVGSIFLWSLTQLCSLADVLVGPLASAAEHGTWEMQVGPTKKAKASRPPPEISGKKLLPGKMEISLVVNVHTS